MIDAKQFRASEIFGYGVDDQSKKAWANRKNKHCPFKDAPCTKTSKENPLGICSISDGKTAAAICPVRYVENDTIFKDAARLAFGENVNFGIFPEIRILRIIVPDTNREQKIGKVDYVLGRVDGDIISDFAAVEVQSTYISGYETRSMFDHYLTHYSFGDFDTKRRPDFRSSAQKRLMPQLQLKVPVFRRWGKKFFVVTDTQFFDALPNFPQTSAANSELTWLTYPIAKIGDGYEVGNVNVIYSSWDEVQNSLREGVPPDPDEIVDELQSKLNGPENKRPRLLDS